MIEYKTMTNDNKIVVNVSFKDQNGSPVEYNPPDKNTGERDNHAPPIIIDIPLHTDLQNLISDPEVTLTDIKELVAKDPNDFMIINEVWQPKPNRYSIYFENSSGMIEVFKPDPNKAEKILVMADDNNLLFARSIVTHTSKWYSALFEEITCNIINHPLPDVKGECEVRATPPVTIDTWGKLITATTTNPTTYSSQGIYSITWIYNDYLHTTQTQRVIVSDTKPPIPDTNPLPAIFSESEITLTPPTAKDCCSGSIKATTTGPTTYSNPGTYILTWSYDDGHGNFTEQKQTVIIERDGPDLSGSWINPDLFNFRSNIHRESALSVKTLSVDNMRQLMFVGWVWGLYNKAIKFQVKNIGNMKVYNRFKIAFYLSKNGTTCEKLLKTKYINRNLNAGQDKTFPICFIKNYDDTWNYIIAVIDPDDQVAETNETSNKITFQF